MAPKGLIILTVLFAFSSRGQDVSKGEQLYKKFQCLECHGGQGEGSVELKTPRIGGQYNWYIESSIQAFSKAKERKHPRMKNMEQLSAGERADLAAYIARLGTLAQKQE